MSDEDKRMSKHTRGPWYLGHADITDHEYDGIIRNIAGNPVASVGFGYSKETAFANARLIAAAPETSAERDRLKALCGEMLDALRKSNRALSTLADHTDDDRMSQRTFEYLLGKNNDAIAKAEEETDE